MRYSSFINQAGRRTSFWSASRILLVLIGTLMNTSSNHAAEQVLYIGSSSSENHIYACRLDVETGEFSSVEPAGDAPRPGFLALHPKLPLLYTITAERAEPGGGVRSFHLDLANASLTPLNQQPTNDEGATHLAVDGAGEMLLVAHYGGGSTALLPLEEDGSIGPVASLVKHTGESVHPDRQKKPYAHGVAIHAGGEYVLVADLGTDEVVVYRVADDQELIRQSSWRAAPGSGPRHVEFHPNDKWVYCINELSSTMSALEFDAENGTLTEISTINMLPDDFTGENTTAEVMVHPSGKFVYGSNRGHDSTAVFSVDSESGALSLVQLEPTQGGHPRFIGLDPTGTLLIAANRDSNNLVSFRVDQKTGKLEPTGHRATAPQPISIVFVPADEG